jgi:hypothetical protein
MPKSKRRPGRPPGIKETKKRQHHARVVPAPEVEWLNKRQAAGLLDVSVSFINRNAHLLGGVKFGDRVLFHRPRLTERALALPPATGAT